MSRTGVTESSCRREGERAEQRVKPQGWPCPKFPRPFVSFALLLIEILRFRLDRSPSSRSSSLFTTSPTMLITRSATLLRPLTRTTISSPLLRTAAYSSTSPVPKACTDYLQPTHLDDSPPKHVTDRLDQYAQVTLTTYSRPPFILTKGSKCSVWDTEGREYLDFSGGIAVNALGHADEGVQRVLTEQSAKLVHNSNLWHNEWSGELALLLVNKTKELGGLGYPGEAAESTTPPVGDATTATTPTKGKSAGLKVFFSNSGTEANEGALKFARKWGKLHKDAQGNTNPDKVEIVSFKDGFHGRTLGALSATWQEKYQAPFAPLVPGFVPATLNDIDSITSAITEKTCGVIVEPIQVSQHTASAARGAPELMSQFAAASNRVREVSLRLVKSSCEHFVSVATRLERFSSLTRSRCAVPPSSASQLSVSSLMLALLRLSVRSRTYRSLLGTRFFPRRLPP